MLRVISWGVLAAALVGCPGGHGSDAGVHDAGADAGRDAGAPDGGVMNDDRCDFGGPRTCPAGQACTLAVLEDAGIARRCFAGACDLIDQDCDAGLKCAFADGGRACLADGTLNEGQSCAGAPVGCRAGLACTFAGSDGGSTCARFCRVNTDCGAPQRCYVTLVLDDTSERPLVCADPPMTCSPLAQDCRAPSDGCYPGAAGPGCYPAGATPPGSGCTYSNDCGRGYACSGTGSTTCKQLCAFGADAGEPSCDAGTCTRLQSSQSVGVCL